MNSYDLSNSSLKQNVLIITRLRGCDNLDSTQKNIITVSNPNDAKSRMNKSKLTQFKNNKSEPNLLNKKIKDNIKYTMFTSKDSSNVMLVSKKPIKGSTINEALKVCDNLYDFHNSILNETSLLEYDKIYNESHSIERIYNEVIKDNIAQLFHKKSSCVFFFGPSSGGKSFLLLGENEENSKNKTFNKDISRYKSNKKINKDNNKKLEGGLLRRSVSNLLNLLKINRQGNENESIQNKYEIRLSIYQVYMDKIYDLLNKKIKNISIKKIDNDDEQSGSINLVGLADVEIRSIQEYEKVLKDVDINKKNLSKVLKVKNLNKNSHVVISLKLQKKIQNMVGTNISDNYTINSFSQIDYVEFVSSEIGLNDSLEDNNNDLSYECNLYNNTKNAYNSIIDNIVCANNGTTPKNESILSISLKNTLRTNNNIVFFNCVIPWEYPINNSYKALKFTTWLRNQVLNDTNNINSNLQINDNIINQGRNLNTNSNNLFNTINDNSSNSNINPQINNSYLINYQNPLSNEQDNNINSYQNQTYNYNFNPNFNNLYPNRSSNNNILIYEDQNDNNHFDPNEEQNIKLMRSRSGGFNDNKPNEIKNQNQNQNQNKSISNIHKNNNSSSQLININENVSTNEKTFQTLEQTLKELEEKKLEIENKMFQEKNKINNSQYNTRSTNINFRRSSSPQKVINKEENKILQSDNIIMKEDIDRLNKINMSLENEISHSRDLISDLQTENQKLKEENFDLKSKLNDYDNYNYTGLYMNGQISKENFLEKNFNEIFLLQNKLKELQNNYNLLQKEKTQYEVDFKVLLSKYDDIKDKYEKCNYELMNNKQINDKELYSIDNKINALSKEVENLRIENSELRQDNEKTRSSLNLMSSERDMYKEKFEDEKYKNELLNKKIFEVENGYNQAMKEKEYEKYYQRQKEENHRNKSETKTKIAQELQNKIQQYRRERLQKKSNEDFY